MTATPKSETANREPEACPGPERGSEKVWLPGRGFWFSLF